MHVIVVSITDNTKHNSVAEEGHLKSYELKKRTDH